MRAVNAHRKDIRNVLISLFEAAVPKTDHVSRAVLTRILCNPGEDFEKPLLDFSPNSHLSVLVSAGVSVCVWQDPVRKAAGNKSVLREIVNDGRELLANFIGTCCKDHFKLYILICTETTFCREYRFKNGKRLIFRLIFLPNFRLINLRVLGLGFRV